MSTRFVKELVKNLIILSIPCALVIYGLYREMLFEALLVIVAWLQMELSWRQIELYRRSEEPKFTVNAVRSPYGIEIIIHNTGPSPAYHVGVLGVRKIFGKSLRPIPVELWEKWIKTTYVDIPPNGQASIATILDEKVLEESLIDIYYDTPFKSNNRFPIFRHKHNEELHVLSTERGLSGPLLNSVYFFYSLLHRELKV